MEASTTQLILTGLITATISVCTSLLLARLTFNFVKRPEMQEALTHALRLEKQKRDLDRAEAVRIKVVTWAYPIKEAANNLYYRLENICDDKGYLPLARDWDSRRPEDWSATHAYFMNSSVYLFGSLFAQVELLRLNLGLDYYPQQVDKDRLIQKVHAVESALSRWPAEFTGRCHGEDRQVFLLEQWAVGQAFFNETTLRAITYAEFLRDAENLSRYTEPFVRLLEDLRPIPAENCRWIRVSSMRGPLIDLQEECQRLVDSALNAK